MEHLTYLYLAGLLILCIQNGCMGVPVEEHKPIERTYSYSAFIHTRSSECDERIGRWSVRANLTLENVGNNQIFQLNDVKVSIFNGPQADLNLTHEEDLPKEAEALTQAFMFNGEDTIFVAADEPLWSANLKKSIASYFATSSNENKIEQTIFGNCEVIYDRKSDKIVEKTINHDACTDKALEHKTNVKPAPAPEGFKSTEIKTVIKYETSDDNIQLIQSWSNITYQPMPQSPNTQHVDQFQEFELISTSASSKQTDVTNLINKKHIIYEYGLESTLGRHKYETNTQILVEQFIDNYHKFKKIYTRQPIENHEMSLDDPVENMIFSLLDMPDEAGFVELQKRIENSDQLELDSTFLSLLPYIGTNYSVQYINDIMTKDSDPDNIQYLIIKLLAIFPTYISNPTEELIKDSEKLLIVKNTQPDYRRNGQILSFASIIRRALEEGTIRDEVFNKYQQLYHDKFLGSNDYEDRMVYLLGLTNMAEGLSLEFIISIITNSTEVRDFRSLALTGFKSKLLSFEASKIFKVFWPIVQNENEEFEVRVAALDLLLSSKLTQEQYQEILETCKKYQFGNIYSRHLSSYFFTTILSLQNSTKYYDPIGNFATETIENVQLPLFPQWTTGNYRLAFTDKEPNVGNYIQTRLTADPYLNTVTSAHISFNQFALSFDMGTYSIYIKCPGIFEFLFRRGFYQKVKEATSVPDLLKLIKKHNFNLKSSPVQFHVDIVIFVDGRAVYMLHTDHTSFEAKKPELITILETTSFGYFTISYPLSDYIHFPSILGTPITIMNDVQDITSFSHPNNDLKYRSSWYFQTWLESYNPLLDTTIASFKYYGEEKHLNTKISYNLNPMVLMWMMQNDTLMWTWDSLIGTTVDDKKLLNHFCPDCEAVHEIPTYNFGYNITKNVDSLGLKLNYTVERNDFSNSLKLEDMLDTLYSNTESVPHSKPLLVPWQMFNYMNYYGSELMRVIHRSLPLAEERTMTLAHFEFENKNPLKLSSDPFDSFHYNVALTVVNKDLEKSKGKETEEEPYLNKWGISYDYFSSDNNNNEVKKQNVLNTYKIDYYFNANNSQVSTLQVCVLRKVYLPSVRTDKVSVEPLENTTATTVIKYRKTNNSTESEECGDEHSIILSETFFTSDEKNKEIKKTGDYEECKRQSNGLTFTPPVAACISTYMAMNQYFNYTVFAELKNISNVITDDLEDYPLFKYSRDGHNKVTYSVLKTTFEISDNDTDKYLHFNSYSPYQSFNPSAFVYRDYEVFDGYKRSCIVTPNTTRSFAGYYVPHKEPTSVPFVECGHISWRGMTSYTISDTKIGFTLWSSSNIVDVSAKDDKLKVNLNGKELSETFVDKDISVRFLKENVLYIADDEIQIYYNTEYIHIKANSMYNSAICGDCSAV